MAEKPVATADRLFREVLAPLVLGGELRPGRPIGGKIALALARLFEPAAEGSGETAGDAIVDKELLAHVELGRVRVARRLAPVDSFHLPNNPSPAEWTLAAVLHDLLQCVHPDLHGVFRGAAPARLLQIATMTVDEVAPPNTVGDALSRHTWFSRALEITRTDTQVSFWVGKRTYLGQDPPGRLLAWPELRRVHVDKNPRPLVELPAAGGHIDAQLFGTGVAAWLKKTPLTDLATCGRVVPAFAWSQETLQFIATRAGRTLALRALDESCLRRPASGGSGDSSFAEVDVEVALGRATKALVDARASQALAIVTALLGERTLASVVARAERRTPEGEAPAGDAFVARAIGAYGASALLAANEATLRADLAMAVRGQLEPWMRTSPAQIAKALLGA